MTTTQTASGRPRPAWPGYAADLVVHGGRVLTLDPARPQAKALAARDGKIVAVGAPAEVLPLTGERTTVLDLGGGVAVPGFIETHNHPLFFGETLAAQVDAGTPPNETIDDLVERVAAAVTDTPAGQWVRGFGYDDTLLRERRHPTRADLDLVSPHHPVFLRHVSGHLAITNSAGLRACHISRDTADPPGGRIVRDADGEPTGVLAETAAFAAQQALPQPGLAELADRLAAAGQAYLAHGVTTVHDTGIGLFGGRRSWPRTERWWPLAGSDRGCMGSCSTASSGSWAAGCSARSRPPCTVLATTTSG